MINGEQDVAVVLLVSRYPQFLCKNGDYKFYGFNDELFMIKLMLVLELTEVPIVYRRTGGKSLLISEATAVASPGMLKIELVSRNPQLFLRLSFLPVLIM